jgi:hypothetical protein
MIYQLDVSLDYIKKKNDLAHSWSQSQGRSGSSENLEFSRWAGTDREFFGPECNKN